MQRGYNFRHMPRRNETPCRPMANRLSCRTTIWTTRAAWNDIQAAAAASGVKPHEWIRLVVADELRRREGIPPRIEPLVIDEPPRRLKPAKSYVGRRPNPLAMPATIPLAASDGVSATIPATDVTDAIQSHPTGPSVDATLSFTV